MYIPDWLYQTVSMRSGAARVALVLALLMVGATPIAGAARQPAAPSDYNSYWTTVATDGTVDEGDTSIVSLSTAFVTLKSTAPTPSYLYIRYNITYVGGLLSTPGYYAFKLRYRDNGTGAQVKAYVRRVSLSSGGVTTRMTFDSNSFTESANYQTQYVFVCGGTWSFDFLDNAFYVEVTLTKSATDGLPALEAIQITSLVC